MAPHQFIFGLAMMFIAAGLPCYMFGETDTSDTVGGFSILLFFSAASLAFVAAGLWLWGL